MKLWILRPIDDEVNRPGTTYPVWSWDCSYGYVVRAEDERGAREMIANSNALCADDWRFSPGDEGAASWLNPELTSCDELTADGAPAILMRDFLAG